MSLRTRIALTFLILLTAVLAAALSAVSIANRANAERDVQRQLEFGAQTFSGLLKTNRRLLTQAAQAVADDYGFRAAVAERDTETLVSALQNSGTRVGAAMVVLTSLDGVVIAASGSDRAAGSQFPIAALKRNTGPDATATVMVDIGKIYQVVAVPVKSPLPVAWIAMGFELDAAAAKDLADATGLGVTLAVRAHAPASSTVTNHGDMVTRPIKLPSLDNTEVVAILSRSMADARAPFDGLTKTLFEIAGVSLFGFGWAAFWIARNITRPLHVLTESVDLIRGGRYDVELSVHRRDELGVLAEGLEHMQTAVMCRDNSIRQLAYEDTLTGLMNRTSFGSRLSEALTHAAGAPMGVAIINLNRFRRINEHLGYSVGDAILKQTATRLATVPSIESAVARLAADQFAAFTRLNHPKDLQAWGTSLLLALSEPVFVEAQPIDISATIGLAVTSAPSESGAQVSGAGAADDLVRCADLALEQARREKRAMSVYEASLNPSARDQLSLLGELRHAVENDELRLFFQPKLEMSTNRVAGAEVLLRWQHPTRGMLSPADFIPFAEQTGFIRRITRWTLSRAIAQAASWHHGGNALPIAVNISADDVADSRLDARVAGLVTRNQLPPSLLTLELTESNFIEDPNRALGMLNALGALGVTLSIDDFGTGYSSLSHLARMPAHEIKIDRSFVQGLETDAEYATVVRSAIDMGHSLGMKVVAEGIETELAADRLRALGCDIAQGYLYAKPMPLDQLERWLEGRARVPVVALPADFNADEVTDTVTLATY
jgi:diguanylate cyclase (GGDEF)-like protein